MRELSRFGFLWIQYACVLVCILVTARASWDIQRTAREAFVVFCQLVLARLHCTTGNDHISYKEPAL